MQDSVAAVIKTSLDDLTKHLETKYGPSALSGSVSNGLKNETDTQAQQPSAIVQRQQAPKQPQARMQSQPALQQQQSQQQPRQSQPPQEQQAQSQQQPQQQHQHQQSQQPLQQTHLDNNPHMASYPANTPSYASFLSAAAAPYSYHEAGQGTPLSYPGYYQQQVTAAEALAAANANGSQDESAYLYPATPNNLYAANNAFGAPMGLTWQMWGNDAKHHAMDTYNGHANTEHANALLRLAEPTPTGGTPVPDMGSAHQPGQDVGIGMVSKTPSHGQGQSQGQDHGVWPNSMVWDGNHH